MATIVIQDSDVENGNLTLSGGSHYRNAKKKEQIHWKLGNNCGVEDIVEICKSPSPPYPPSTNIFSTLPHRNGQSKNWSAEIGEPAGKSEYIYYIKWIPIGGTEPLTYDPKISIKPDISGSITKIILCAITGLVVFAGALSFLKERKRASLSQPIIIDVYLTVKFQCILVAYMLVKRISCNRISIHFATSTSNFIRADCSS